MDNDLEKYTLGEGVELIAVPAGRFKTNEISVSFATELHPQHAAANALALRVIASVSRSYPTPSALSRELAYLYGADLQPLIMKSGASQVLSLGLTCIDDRYSMDAQSIGAQAAALLCDLIFHPRLQEDGQFFKEDVDREKEQLIQQICAEENDKRVYAYHRLEEEMFRGEPCSVSRFGTAEQVAALTPADVREALTRLVETAKVVVTVVGSCGVGQIKDLFADAFSAVSRRYAAPPVVAAASAPEEPRFVTDRENVKQGKLVLGFRVDCAPDSAFAPAVRSAADVFGGGPYSKLFVHVREKMSLVATCFVMKHFLNRTDNIVWAPIALDEIVRATGSIGITQDGLFSKKDLGLDGPISDDILMMGIRRNDNKELDVFFYPVEVKVLADDSVNKGEIQIANLYNKAFKEVLFKGDTFTRKVYRALFASQFLSNMEKMRANDLIYDIDYEKVNDSRYELLNVKFNIIEKLPEEIGKAALVVYSDATPKSLSTEWIDEVPVCHIRMMESDCYRIVANPDSALLQFVEESPIVVTAKSETDLSLSRPLCCSSDYTPSSHKLDIVESEKDGNEDKDIGEESLVVPLKSCSDNDNYLEQIHGFYQGVKIRIGKDRKGAPIIFEANNTKKVSHPNMGIVGGMGFGKTQFALSLIAQFAKESEHNVNGRPIGMLIFDYKGDDYSTEAFLNNVNGQCYSFNFPFNPLKLVVTDKTKFMNLPAVTADRISDSFAKAYGLGQVQQSTIKQVILETYNDFGITSNSSTWNKPQPTMNNVVDKYFEKYDAKDKTYALFDKLRDYMIFTPDNSECVSLFEWLDGVKVIDLTPYPGDTKKVIVSLILDLFYEEMRQLGASKLDDPYRELRAMILVDEAHQFLNKDFNSFRNIISEGRMFGVGMVLSTQNLSDFKSAKQEYSQFILSWVILHMNNITKAEVANIFGSNDPNCQAYVDIVSKAEKFYGICKIGNEVKAIRTLPYYELIKNDERFLEK